MTQPGLAEDQNAQNYIIVAPYYKDPVTGSLYVHEDLERVNQPWEEEAHIPPIKAHERFGDVQSWVEYIAKYGDGYTELVTWNSQGLKATLDYHTSTEKLGRCQWIAEYPFTFAPEWLAWRNFANGMMLTQAQVIEKLEELGETITSPDATSLMNLLRKLRATVKSEASTELKEDGSTSVSFSQDKSVNKTGDVALPSVITIVLPVLKGHADDAGRPVAYEVTVRLRASIDNLAHLTFRLSLQNVERVLEVVYAEQVQKAKDLLGDSFTPLRAAG